VLGPSSSSQGTPDCPAGDYQRDDDEREDGEVHGQEGQMGSLPSGSSNEPRERPAQGNEGIQTRGRAAMRAFPFRLGAQTRVGICRARYGDRSRSSAGRSMRTPPNFRKGPAQAVLIVVPPLAFWGRDRRAGEAPPLLRVQAGAARGREPGRRVAGRVGRRGCASINELRPSRKRPSTNRRTTMLGKADSNLLAASLGSGESGSGLPHTSSSARPRLARAPRS
jgi:hypothetical protein